MDMTMFERLSKLCDTLESATIMATTMQLDVDKDDTLYELHDLVDNMRMAVRDAAERAYMVNNELTYIMAREEPEIG
jgi:hypothetical protein